MRAHEFINRGKKTFRGITPRQLNKEKRDYMRRKASLEQRQRLIPLMYANRGKAHERLEFEKARLDLELQMVELAKAKAEARAETLDAISGMAKAGAEAGRQGQSKVTSMARAEIRQRKPRAITAFSRPVT